MNNSGSKCFLSRIVYFFPLPRRKFSAATNGTCEEELTEKVGAWDFVEHSQRSYCSCSRSVPSHVDGHTVCAHMCIQRHFKKVIRSTELWTLAQRATVSKISASYSHVWTLTSILFFIFFSLLLFCLNDSWVEAETSAGCVSVSRTFLFPRLWE